MTARLAVESRSRALLRVSGEDARSFLQGLISNDVEKATSKRALWAAFLTPQGKFLHDLFVYVDPAGTDPNTLLVECEADRRDDLLRRLRMYKLRARVTLEPVDDDYAVVAFFGDEALAALGLPGEPGHARPLAGGLVYVDPRLAALGARAAIPRPNVAGVLAGAGFETADTDAYDRLRLSLGVPDGARDLEVERSPLLENGFDELNGIDWEKGCFLGQELTARTRYRALIKKRLLPVTYEGPPPPSGTPITRGGKDVGVMRSGVEGIGLALLRLEHIQDSQPGELMAGVTPITVRPPPWLSI